jgi:hypothetical protein
VSEHPGRNELLRWRATKPSNYFAAVPGLAVSFELWMGTNFTPGLREKLANFGEEVATTIETAVQIVENNREFPKVHHYDALGQHGERIEFHPARDDAARVAWTSGMLATPLNYEGAFELPACSFSCRTSAKGDSPVPSCARWDCGAPWRSAPPRPSRIVICLGSLRPTPT